LLFLEYGALEGEVLKTLDYNLIVHTLFGPLEMMRKSLLVDVSEEERKRLTKKLARKARMTFFNNWMFLYPPGILALAVFKLVYEESGIQDFESLISK
jgi:hypothetical protein